MASGVSAQKRYSRVSAGVARNFSSVRSVQASIVIDGRRRQTRNAKVSTPCGGTEPTSTAAGALCCFEVALDHEAAQGMADQDRPAAQIVGDRTDVVEVVGDGNLVQRLGCGAGAVPAQAHRHRAVAGVGEVIQEMVVPAPRAMPAAVHEKQRHGMVLAAGSLIDHLEHELTFVGGGFSVKLFPQLRA